jgi:hypothetical protein
MARPKKQEQETTTKKAAGNLDEAVRQSLPAYSIGVTPITHIPINSIGYQVMIQNTGFPINCISMSIADTGAGKTTHSHVIANWFIRAGGNVIHIEGDGIMDEAYIGRFYDFNPTTLEERIQIPLDYYIKLLEKRLDKRSSSKIPTLVKNTLATRLIAAKNARKVESPAKIMLDRNHREILFLAQTAYRSRHIIRLDADSSEELENIIEKVYTLKLKTDPNIEKPTLFIIDPIGNFLPEELVKEEDSASGRKMAIASYLHQFFRRWSKKLADAQIHLHLTAKQATHIPKPYEFASELDRLVTAGGGAQKLAATLIYHITQPRTVKKPTPDQAALVEDVLPQFRLASIQTPKRKVQGGASLHEDYRSHYWLFTARDNTRMDFDLPFLQQVFALQLFDIRYTNGYVFIPPEFIPECDPSILKKADKDGVKLRRAEAANLLKNATAWHHHIHDILGISYQEIENTHGKTGETQTLELKTEDQPETPEEAQLPEETPSEETPLPEEEHTMETETETVPA